MKPSALKGWLLDTDALLWMLHGDRRLTRKARELIDGSLPLYHSSASFWEMAIKLSGKGFNFEIEDDWEQFYPEELKRIGVPLLSPTVLDFRLLQDLPKHHGDPLDRLLVCQATRNRLGIISADAALDAYEVMRVW
ncbi:MAG: type II toxin-antitoxin system VapC family toxin [Verrucomicrobiales bacterium]